MSHNVLYGSNIIIIPETPKLSKISRIVHTTSLADIVRRGTSNVDLKRMEDSIKPTNQSSSHDNLNIGKLGYIRCLSVDAKRNLNKGV